jgi:hypothetical protein
MGMGEEEIMRRFKVQVAVEPPAGVAYNLLILHVATHAKTA